MDGYVCVVANFGEARSNSYETNTGEKKAQFRRVWMEEEGDVADGPTSRSPGAEQERRQINSQV
jgi:hypothetical protein